jgi:hypothetical protein
MYFDEIMFDEINNVVSICKKINHNSTHSQKKSFFTKCLNLKNNPLWSYFFKGYEYNKYLKHGIHLFDKEIGINCKSIDELLCMLVCVAEIFEKEKRSEEEEYCYRFMFNNLWYLLNIEKIIYPIENISKCLNKQNIEETIEKYMGFVNEIEINVFENPVHFFDYIKRGKIKNGPYPYVSPSEASNRILTDFVILFGIKMLLNNYIPEINFSTYDVDYGNKNEQEHDIIVKDNLGIHLIGEAFNVSKSLLSDKKRKSVRKLEQNKKNLFNLWSRDIITIIMYNSDVEDRNSHWILKNNIYYLKVDVNDNLKAIKNKKIKINGA